jgi:hypothetical protein
MSARSEVHAALMRAGYGAPGADGLLDQVERDAVVKGGALVESRACDADWRESRDFCAGLREAVEVLGKAAGSEKDTRGVEPHEGESTPEPPRPHALPESSFARARQCERIGGFFRCARIGKAEAEDQRGAL